MNVTNKGMSDFANVPVQRGPPAASFTQLSAKDDGDAPEWIQDALTQMDKVQNSSSNASTPS